MAPDLLMEAECSAVEFLNILTDFRRKLSLLIALTGGKDNVWHLTGWP